MQPSQIPCLYPTDLANKTDSDSDSDSDSGSKSLIAPLWLAAVDVTNHA